MWLKNQRCEGVVQAAWEEGLSLRADYTLGKCMEICRTRLEGWNKTEFSHVSRKISELQKRLEWIELQPTTPNIAQLMRNTRIELNGWLEKEDAMWCQRSKLTWFQEGDRNTRFFHTKASARYKKNLIEGLMDANGVWQKEEQIIEEIVVDYYKNLFTTSSPTNFNEILEAEETKVSPSMNHMLNRDFTAREVEQALKQMHPQKAPGPNDMPPLFFQHFWSISGEEVTKTVLDFLNLGIFPPNFNETNIVLIPKVNNPKIVTDFRPISLCNVVYKIASKAIANRLKKILATIISDMQSAFVNGRLIIDNVIVAFEVMHHISQKKEGRVGEMALKLDISKAYDRVEWECLDKIMEKLGFDGKWRGLIMKCVTTITYAVRINGSPRGHIVPTRGIRQGDPLSPYLFLLCAEGLSAFIKHSVTAGNLEGIAICRGGPKLSHLFFTDDSLIFCKASLSKCNTLQRIFHIYEQASGQQLNRAKTSLFFSKNTPSEIQEELKTRFGAQVIKQHERYLGLPSLAGRNKQSTFKSIKENSKRNWWGGKRRCYPKLERKSL